MFSELLVKLLLKNALHISWNAASLLINSLLDIIVKAERKFGRKKGKEKAEYVRKWLKENLGNNKEWIINFIVELGVFLAKRKGLII